MADATASRHNLLQARLDQILGIGSGQTGYGQGLPNYGPSLSSYPVSNQADSNVNIISAADINAIYADMLRARIHQVGTAPTEIAELVSELNIIAENESYFVNDSSFNIDLDPEGSKKGITDFERLMNLIESDKFLMHPSQATLENAISSIRSTVWNGLIYHEFTVSFIDENHRRHFFNSGGEIRISSLITGAQTAKGRDWATLLSNSGIISMNHDSTVSSNFSGSSTIGNYSLTSSYQTIYQKSSQGVEDAVYAGNLYKISAKTVTSSEIRFKVEYNDISTGNVVDVNVDGILENEILFYRAESSYVSVPKPVVTTEIPLSSFETPLPIYSLSASSPAVSEGDSVTVTLTTVNIPNGTLVPYNIQGVTSADISNAPLSGNFVVQNNTAQLIVNVATDTLLVGDDTETLIVRLENGSSRVSINIVDTTPDPVYELLSSANEIYEGFGLTFTLNVQNLASGTQVPYTISGVTSDDIQGQPLVGNFTLDTNGSDSLDVFLTLDDFEETETLTLSIDGTNISKSVLVKDAIYTILSNNSSPIEGDTVTIQLITDSIPNNTVVPYTISGVSADDINIPLTGSFTVQNNRAEVSVLFTPDIEVDPNEQFTLALDNGKASITLNVEDNPLPTSANRTCIAVIDEASVGGYDPTASVLSAAWDSFRLEWPDRPFYLLQPNILSNGTQRFSGDPVDILRVPSAFISDPIATGPIVVNRDENNTSRASDWYTLCDLDQLPDGSALALYIDTSGSMDLDTVRASFNLFKQKIAARNMTIIEVYNANENWIAPFEGILD